MNNLPIDTSDSTPYIIMIRLGGIKNPRVPAPAREPIASFWEYPLFFNSLRVIFPTVAVVAALEPLTAANKEQATTLRCKSFPGIRENHGKRPLKSL